MGYAAELQVHEQRYLTQKKMQVINNFFLNKVLNDFENVHNMKNTLWYLKMVLEPQDENNK